MNGEEETTPKPKVGLLRELLTLIKTHKITYAVFFSVAIIALVGTVVLKFTIFHDSVISEQVESVNSKVVNIMSEADTEEKKEEAIKKASDLYEEKIKSTDDQNTKFEFLVAYTDFLINNNKLDEASEQLTQIDTNSLNNNQKEQINEVKNELNQAVDAPSERAIEDFANEDYDIIRNAMKQAGFTQDKKDSKKYTAAVYVDNILIESPAIRCNYVFKNNSYTISMTGVIIPKAIDGGVTSYYTISTSDNNGNVVNTASIADAAAIEVYLEGFQ